MNAEELVRIIDTWTDALNVAEVVGSPFLRVGADWDLSDWQATELADGLRFQRLDGAGDVTEEVVVLGDARRAKEVCAPAGGDVPTWLVRLGDSLRPSGSAV